MKRVACTAIAVCVQALEGTGAGGNIRGLLRRMGPLRRTGVCAAFLTMLLVGPASAAQQQDAHAYAYWNLSAGGGIWNVDQNIEIRETAASTYWAGNWQWNNSNPSSGGYFGLQENGVRFDGTSGSTAIFSVWNANGARGPSCGTFTGEGTGYSCRIAYPIRTDRMYRLRLWRQEADSSGQWWGAWIKDQATGVEQSIGGLRAPLNATAVSGYMNFTEYFGEAVPAKDRVPRSIADYTQPAANHQGEGRYETVGSFTGSAVGSGTTGTVEPISLGWTNAARITMGNATPPRLVPPAPAMPPPVMPPSATPSPSRCSVPPLRGRSLKGARKILKRARCKLGKVTWKGPGRARPHIYSQRPKPGTPLRAGGKVSVTIKGVPKRRPARRRSPRRRPSAPRRHPPATRRDGGGSRRAAQGRLPTFDYWVQNSAVTVRFHVRKSRWGRIVDPLFYRASCPNSNRGSGGGWYSIDRDSAGTGARVPLHGLDRRGHLASLGVNMVVRDRHASGTVEACGKPVRFRALAVPVAPPPRDGWWTGVTRTGRMLPRMLRVSGHGRYLERVRVPLLPGCTFYGGFANPYNLGGSILPPDGSFAGSEVVRLTGAFTGERAAAGSLAFYDEGIPSPFYDEAASREPCTTPTESWRAQPGNRPPALPPSPQASPVKPEEPPKCAGSGAGGWSFRAHVSDNDGLVLDEASYGGRRFSNAISVPYLDGLWIQGKQRGEARLELTPLPAKAHPGVFGATLVEFECKNTGDGDLYVRALYSVNNFLPNGGDGVGPSVTQEYRFRGRDGRACEVSGKVRCARFWPTVAYTPGSLAQSCSSQPGSTPSCTLFRGLRTVQRLELAPGGRSGGAINAYQDRGLAGTGLTRSVVDTKGSDGSMKYEAMDQAIRNGKRGDWDSIHQSPVSATSSPGINPFNKTPGCRECVHMHWAWGTTVNVGSLLDRSPRYFTDGKPEILDHSEQDTVFGIVRLEPGETDPVYTGWRRLINVKSDPASNLRGHTPVVYWEMTSTAGTDATFPVLRHYRHGGNGAIFFAGTE